MINTSETASNTKRVRRLANSFFIAFGKNIRFAIDKRNLWMIERSDTAVVYVNGKQGNSYKYARIAEGKGKRVINLANS